MPTDGREPGSRQRNRQPSPVTKEWTWSLDDLSLEEKIIPLTATLVELGSSHLFVIFATRSEYLDYTPYLLCCSYHPLVSDLFRWSLFRC